MIFDESGSLANTSRHDYLPFGEEIFAGTAGRTTTMGYTAPGYSAVDGARQKFTSKERDIETGLDFFEARYYASTQGRFTSADPLLASGRPGSPQSWNRYSYVLNNPLRRVDPTGMLDQEPKGGTCSPSTPCKLADENQLRPEDAVIVEKVTVPIGPSQTEPIQTNETPLATNVEMRPTEAPPPTPSDERTNAGAPTFRGVSFGLSAGLIGGTVNVKRDKFGNWYVSGRAKFRVIHAH